MKIFRKIFTIRSKIQHESKTVEIKKTRNLHGTLKWVLFIAQCFGQMPVLGVTEPNSRSLKFSWKSLRTIYCILNCVGSGVISAIFFYQILKSGANLYECASLAFYFNNLMATIFFLKLAREWPLLMRKWSSVEFTMRNYGWPQHLHTRIALMSTTVLSMAAVETMMAKTNKLYVSPRCKKATDDVAEYYSRVFLDSEVFLTIDYALWKAILIMIENVLATFAWSFNDLFIMLMSTSLALRFKQITARLQSLKTNFKVDNISVWRETREDYNRLSKFARDIDEALSYITLTSFASNLFFILMQLFNSIRKMKNTLEKIYFFFSFGFLILRTICVSLYGAWIYDESKEPLGILNYVSSDLYNVEVRRFIEQINFDTVALTGKRFFYITRGLVLSMAGAIVTYELVLIQFNDKLLRESAEAAKNATEEC